MIPLSPSHILPLVLFGLVQRVFCILPKFGAHPAIPGLGKFTLFQITTHSTRFYIVPNEAKLNINVFRGWFESKDPLLCTKWTIVLHNIDYTDPTRVYIVTDEAKLNINILRGWFQSEKSIFVHKMDDDIVIVYITLIILIQLVFILFLMKLSWTLPYFRIGLSLKNPFLCTKWTMT